MTIRRFKTCKKLCRFFKNHNSEYTKVLCIGSNTQICYKYRIYEIDDEGHFIDLLKYTNCKPELKIWMDLKGYMTTDYYLVSESTKSYMMILK